MPGPSAVSNVCTILEGQGMMIRLDNKWATKHLFVQSPFISWGVDRMARLVPNICKHIGHCPFLWEVDLIRCKLPAPFCCGTYLEPYPCQTSILFHCPWLGANLDFGDLWWPMVPVCNEQTLCALFQPTLGARIPGNMWSHVNNIVRSGALFSQCNCWF